MSWKLTSVWIICVFIAFLRISDSYDLIDVCSFVVPKFTKDDTRTISKHIPMNVAAYDIAIWKAVQQDFFQHIEIFITTPRIKPGTPVTLSTVVTDNNRMCILSPYPSWAANHLNCNGLVSVYAIKVDFCDRLWVLDSGVVDQGTMNPKRTCRPKILVFDLQTDALLGNYQIPTTVLSIHSLLINIVVDIRNNRCEDAFAYIADATAFNLIVFDYHQLQFWKFHNRFFYPYPSEGKIEINNVPFVNMFGISAMALGPVIKEDRILHFHSLASVKESWVKTSFIRNSKNAIHSNSSLVSSDGNFKVSLSSRSSQSAAEDMTSNGIMILGLLGKNSLACWSRAVASKTFRLVELIKNPVKLQYISGLKIYEDDDLWILSSSFQKYITDQLRLDEMEYNYRIMRVSIGQLIRDSKCLPKLRSPKRHGNDTINHN